MWNENRAMWRTRGASLAVWLALGAVLGVLLATAELGRKRPAREVAAPVRADDAATQIDDGVQDPAWGEPLEGLQFRLRSERTTWQSWQQPVVVLDVRNTSDKVISASELRNRVPVDHRHGLMLLRKPSAMLSDTDSYYGLEVQTRFDAEVIAELQPGGTLSLPMAIVSTSRSHEASLSADQFVVGLGKQLPQVEPEFVSNFVAVGILPPGVRSLQELDAHLKRYDADGRVVDAGFVPSGTTLVDGERIVLTFIVRNSGEQKFGYSFGGDYRGANRHNRFKIEVRDETGNLLPDPANQFGDMGGILMPRNVEPNRLTADTLDLPKYRKIPGPGRYSVTARFDLESGFFVSDGKFNVPVEAKFDLTILPRTAANVAAVLERLFHRCDHTSGAPLQDTIDILCEFGQDAAIPGLARLARTGLTERRQAAILGLGKIPVEASLIELLPVERDPPVRAAALLALGAFHDERAVNRAVESLADPDENIRKAGAAALGQMKTDVAVRALLDRFEAAGSREEAAAILAALGESGAREAFERVVTSLERKEDVVRRAAVLAIVRFPASDAAAALRRYAADEDMDFRETVIRTLAETLRVPIDADLLAPVIRSRRGTNTIGDAPRLLRLYSDDKAAPTLLSCLDVDDPSIRNYYNLTIIEDQLACRTGLAIPWISDLNRDGTPEEEQRNRQSLAQLKVWLDRYRQKPWSEPPQPWRLPNAQEEQTWGPEVNGVRI